MTFLRSSGDGEPVPLDRYGGIIARAAAGLIELADRDRHSPSYGCFDYSYWRSKTSGYVNARFQEAAYTLALLYRNDYPGNRFRGLREAGELARAGIRRWAALQNSDGSFDEWYRGEHGFAATAFSSFALARAFPLLEDLLEESERERLRETFRRAAGWLVRHNDLVKINHQAVAAAALYRLGELLGDPGLAEAAGEKVDSVLARQTGEGWFPELGGVDTGYSFLTLEYLAHCLRSSPSERLEKALLKALDFLSFFVHPEISTGREYNLCGNSYVSLLAAALLSPVSPLARRIFTEGIARDNLIRQLAQDDLSRCYHLYTGLLAYDSVRENRASLEEPTPPLPCGGPPLRKVFPRAGLAAVRGGDYYAVISLSRGGLLKAFPYPRGGRADFPSCLDRGYTLRRSAGATATLHSCLLSPGIPLRESEAGSLEVVASFRRAGYFFPGRLSRAALAVIGSLPYGYLLLKKGVDFVRRRKKASLQLTGPSGAASDWRLERRIEFLPDRIRVGDRVSAGSGRNGAGISIELEEALDSRVTGRPLSSLEDELNLELARRGEVLIEKELIFTPAGIEVAGGLVPPPAQCSGGPVSDRSESSAVSGTPGPARPAAAGRGGAR